MRKYIYFYLILIISCHIHLPNIVFATDYAIVINGGDPNGTVTEWRSKIATEFITLLKKKNSEIIIVDSDDEDEICSDYDEIKNSIIRIMKNKLTCEDNIIIYFNGHGNSSGVLTLKRTQMDEGMLIRLLKMGSVMRYQV